MQMEEEWTSSKRARMDEDIEAPLAFSTFLSNSVGNNKRHPVLSDKKLVTYDLKVERPELPLYYEQNSLNRLGTAISAIHNNQPVPESLEVLYQLCEDLCQYDKAEAVYELMYSECSAYAQQQFQILASHIQQGTHFLTQIVSLWKSFCDQMTQIRCLFLYLDRTYIATHIKSGSLWNVAMELFRDNYLQYADIRERFLTSILDLIIEDRQIVPTNQHTLEANTLLQTNIRMLMDLNLYHSEFEQAFLEKTRSFYAQEGDHLLETMDMSDYLGYVANRIHQESILRVKFYFDKSTKPALQTIVEEELLTKRVEYILDKSFSYFQDKDKLDELSLLYRLLKKVGKLDICNKYFTNYVKTKGSSTLCEKSSTREIMNNLTSFKRKTEYIVGHSFEGDERFVAGLKDGTESFINLRSNNAINLLAKHTDAVLKSEKFDEKSLDQGMLIFKYLQGKDEFEVLYKRDLAKRLLLDVMNRNSEKIMLGKMKKECGPAYTSKLEGMLRDIKSSSDTMDEFISTYPQLANIKVNILTHGFWPSYIPVNMNIPPVLQTAQTLYTDFYTEKYPRRRLTWQNALSVCEVVAHYPRGIKNITLTLLQTAVLLLFNDTTKQSFSFAEIQVYTQLDELELRRTLTSLVSSDYKLLTKLDGTDEMRPTDQFMYNHDFYTEEQNLKMTGSTLSEVIEKNSPMNKTILFSTQEQIDAAIVRIMKSKVRSSHTSLLEEVTRQVRFQTTAQDVKARVEILIDKEYLDREGE
ncbi:Cullin-domain-containing protein, partial [Backusella circina FSU 941]